MGGGGRVGWVGASDPNQMAVTHFVATSGGTRFSDVGFGPD